MGICVHSDTFCWRAWMTATSKKSWLSVALRLAMVLVGLYIVVNLADLRFDTMPAEAACDALVNMTNSLQQLPLDCSYLLPLLRSYAYNQPNVVELGSRYGLSTALLSQLTGIENLVTVDLLLTEEVRGINKIARMCHGDSRSRKIIEADDMVVPMPFGEGRAIDFLFLDTLHNGVQLYRELQRYPAHVKTRMVFHDPTSFMRRDELPYAEKPSENDYPGWEAGLRWGMRQFLSQTTEWVEEIYYPHDNGLLVLKRVGIDFEGDAEVRDVNLGSYSDEATVEELFRRHPLQRKPKHWFSRDQLRWARPRMRQCANAFPMKRTRRICTNHNRQGQADSPYRDAYNEMIVLPQRTLPLATILPSIYGYNMAVHNRRPADETVVLVGCIPSVIVALLHSNSILGNRLVVVAGACDFALRHSKRVQIVHGDEHHDHGVIVYVPVSVLVQHKATAFHQRTQVVFVFGTGRLTDDQRELMRQHSFVVDSAVTFGVGYVVLRREKYDEHRYARDEPTSVMPRNPKYMWTSATTGKVTKHISLGPHFGWPAFEDV